MKKAAKCSLLCLMTLAQFYLPAVARSRQFGNSCPIILVHGFAGLESTSIPGMLGDEMDLEQWGLQYNDNATLDEYLQKMQATIGDTMDFSVHELSAYGARRFNMSVNLSTMDPDAWHFSIANEQTYSIVQNRIYIPSIDMHPILYPYALILGSSPPATDILDIGPAWRQNDGPVNTASMRAPGAGYSDPQIAFDGSPVPGAWNYLGGLRFDHFAIIGHGGHIDPFMHNGMQSMYLELCALLYRLE